jgi:hypothetical protein
MPVATATMPVATATVPVATAAVPVAAAPALAHHSGTATHSGAPTHEMMSATAATARCSCENWRSQYHCNKASQEKQKFRIIHNRSGFLSTSLDTARDSKSHFIFTASEE